MAAGRGMHAHYKNGNARVVALAQNRNRASRDPTRARGRWVVRPASITKRRVRIASPALADLKVKDGLLTLNTG